MGSYDFSRWPSSHLRGYLQFCGKNPGKYSDHELADKAKKLYKKDPQRLTVFLSQYGQPPGVQGAYAPPPVYQQPQPYGAPYAPPPYPGAGVPAPYPGGGPPQAPYGTPPYGAPPAPYGVPPPAGGSAGPYPVPGPGPAAAYPPPAPAAGGFPGAPPQPIATPPQHGMPAAAYPGVPPAGGSAPPFPQAAAQPQNLRSQPARVGAGAGQKRALIVGCNYPGTSAQLQGCINDANCMKYLLQTKFGFPEAGIRMLRDDTSDPSVRPTRANLLQQFSWLVANAQPGDSLWFSFSGHGSQKRDRTGEESDGMNETLLPTDYKTAGQLVDDEINQRLVNHVPQGVTLHCVIDACHSGTACDLPYYTRLKGGTFHWKTAYPHGTRTWKGTAGGLCVQFGACSDDETAADTAALSKQVHTGAATFLFIEAIEAGGTQQTYGQILRRMLDQIQRVNKHRGSGGGGLGGMGGLLGGALLGGLMGGGAGMMLGGLAGGAMSVSQGGIRGQTPQLSASSTIDLDTTPMRI